MQNVCALVPWFVLSRWQRLNSNLATITQVQDGPGALDGAAGGPAGAAQGSAEPDGAEGAAAAGPGLGRGLQVRVALLILLPVRL